MANVACKRIVLRIDQCSAEKFDEAFLRVTKGESVEHGFFSYPQGALARYLLIRGGEPLCAAWDDGAGGRSTTLKEFFEGFLHEPQELTFAETDEPLVNAIAASWQRIPDAHISAGLLDPSLLVRSLLERGKEAVVRVRTPLSYSFALIGGGQLKAFYAGSAGSETGDSQMTLSQIISRNPDDVALDVFEDPEPAKSEDWAPMPPEFTEGMVRFFSLTAPHMLLLLGGRELQRLELNTGRCYIGRDPSNDLVIDNLSVSRRHAVVTYNDGLCTIEDLGSSNGTLLDGQRITQPTPLTDSLEVVIGKHTVRFIARAAVQDQASQQMAMDATVYMRPAGFAKAASVPERPPQVPILTVAGQSVVVRQTPFSLGEAEDCSLRLQGRGVKPVHAVLKRDAGGQLWIAHEGGMLSATRINGQKVKVAPLQSGDLIQIGSMLLRFHLRADHSQ